MYLVFHNVKLLLLLFLPSCEGFFKNKKNTRQDSWLPANTLDKRVIQSRPRLLATQSLIGREEWLPPNGYSPQHMYHDLSVSYVTRVVQPLLFQPYASCYPLTHSSAFQHKMRYLMGRLPIVQSQVFFLKDGPENWGCGITLLRCRWKTGRNNEAQTWTLRQFTNDRNKRAEITGGKMVPIQKKCGHGLYIPQLANHAPCSVSKSVPHPGEILVYLYPPPHDDGLAHALRCHRTRYRIRPRGLTLRGVN